MCLQCGNQTRVLQHYWYTSWPDHKTPDSTMPLLQLMADVEADRCTVTSVGPPIVHCRYGGKTEAEFSFKTTHPHVPARLQCWDWSDWLLHCDNDRLPAATDGGCGGRAQNHLSTPS